MRYQALLTCPHCQQWSTEIPESAAVQLTHNGLRAARRGGEPQVICGQCQGPFPGSLGLSFRKVADLEEDTVPDLPIGARQPQQTEVVTW